jgi:hypothetical protein
MKEQLKMKQDHDAAGIDRVHPGGQVYPKIAENALASPIRTRPGFLSKTAGHLGGTLGGSGKANFGNATMGAMGIAANNTSGGNNEANAGHNKNNYNGTNLELAQFGGASIGGNNGTNGANAVVDPLAELDPDDPLLLALDDLEEEQHEEYTIIIQ